ncbi:MAG: DUF4412 domain-containing protein, partial [Bacteroidales bacterium]
KILLSLFVLSFSLNLCGQFTAILKNTVKGTTRTFRVYSGLDRYRYEFEESGMKGIVIAAPEKNQMWLLLPDEKYIYKTTGDDFTMAANDPVAGIKMYSKNGEVKNTGNETVAGYDCEISEYYQGDTKVFTAWYSPELNFIIKATNHMAENSYMELTGIQDWEVVPSLFEEPAGYTEVDSKMRPKIPEPEPPEEWTAVKLDLPVNDSFERGTKLHMVVNYDKYTKINYTNETDVPAKVIYYSSVEGKSLPEDEIPPVRFRTRRLYPGESKTLTLDLKNGQEVTIEVHEGKMHIEAGSE